MLMLEVLESKLSLFQPGWVAFGFQAVGFRTLGLRVFATGMAEAAVLGLRTWGFRVQDFRVCHLDCWVQGFRLRGACMPQSRADR